MVSRGRGGRGYASGRGRGGARIPVARPVQQVREVDSAKMEEIKPGPECIKVSKLPPGTTEDTLKDELSAYGTVRRCKVTRNKSGIGYVWFEDVAVATMLKEATAMEAFSTVLEVSQALGARPLPGAPPPVEARAAPVRTAPTRAPASARAVPAAKPTFVPKKVAVAKPVLKAKPVRASLPAAAVDADKAEEINPGMDCVKVTGVPATISEADLGEALQAYGAVRRVKIPNQRPNLPGVGYVWFQSEETADYCKGLGVIDALGTALEIQAAPGARPLGNGKGKGKGKGKGQGQGKGKGKGQGKGKGRGGFPAPANPYKRARR